MSKESKTGEEFTEKELTLFFVAVLAKGLITGMNWNAYFKFRNEWFKDDPRYDPTGYDYFHPLSHTAIVRRWKEYEQVQA